MQYNTPPPQTSAPSLPVTGNDVNDVAVLQNIDNVLKRINTTSSIQMQQRNKSDKRHKFYFRFLFFAIIFLILTRVVSMMTQYKVLFDFFKDASAESKNQCNTDYNCSPWNIVLNVEYPWIGQLIMSRPIPNSNAAYFLLYCINDQVLPTHDQLQSWYTNPANVALKQVPTPFDFMSEVMFENWSQSVPSPKNTTAYILQHLAQTPWSLFIPSSADITKNTSKGSTGDILISKGLYGMVEWISSNNMSASDLYQSIVYKTPKPPSCGAATKATNFVSTTGSMAMAGSIAGPVGAGVGALVGVGLSVWNLFSKKKGC